MTRKKTDTQTPPPTETDNTGQIDQNSKPDSDERQAVVEPAGPPIIPVVDAPQYAPLSAVEESSQAGDAPEVTKKPKRKRPPRRRDRKKESEKADEQPASPTIPSPKNEQLSTQALSKRLLLINTDEPEECRIALLENGRIESFHVETISHEQTKGNIYRGKITAVEANLQAAFVDIGTDKNGFLPFGDIHPEYYFKDIPPEANWKNFKIQDVVRKGQEVLVQVVKEVVGNKGANMTTFLSLPGRYLVLMPGSDSAGISRKIEDEEQRRHLREMMETIKRPEGIGYIIRTASNEITKTALSQDMRYLLNLWKEVKKKGQEMPTPSLIYKEENVISRFLRDYFTSDIDEIIVDNQEVYEQVVRFLELLPSRQKDTLVKHYQGSQPIFNHFDVEKKIDQIYQPTVPLPSGGSIVINPTEALVAIDVNSGRTSKDKSFDETIFLVNMEAAEEMARQVRLRDLGGFVVVDFIDMRDQRHIREVEKQVKNCLKKDKAKTDISKISKFGLLQISRQKLASPIQSGSYKTCEHCQGRGVVRSVETLALVYLRNIQTGVAQKNVIRVECRLPLQVAQYILNKKRADLLELENRFSVPIVIFPDPQMLPSEEEIKCITG